MSKSGTRSVDNRRADQGVIDSMEAVKKANDKKKKYLEIEEARSTGKITNEEANKRAAKAEAEQLKTKQWNEEQDARKKYYADKNRLGRLFNNEGGLLVPREGYAKGDKVESQEDPVRQGLSFLGLSDSSIDKVIKATGDIPEGVADAVIYLGDKAREAGLLDDPRKKKQEGGMPVSVEQDMPVDTYPNIPPEEMAEAEASQLPDDEMEDEFIDFILDEALVEEEQTYLMNSLEADPQLSVIFDKLIGTASEFSGAGEVDGPGTGVSDSIPARLSDGEFVMTRKATDAIGPDNLQSMMDEAEMAYDIDGGEKIKRAFGGVVKDENLEEGSSKDYLSQTDEEIKKVMIGANKMPSVR